MTIEEIRAVIENRLYQTGEEIDGSFIFGKYIDRPDVKGVFEIKDKWFIYESDERNVKSITGPFDGDDIVYACTKFLHKSKFFEEYRFSDKAREIYIHVHYRNMKEAEESV